MAYTVKILATPEMLNHNVKRFTTERPQGLNYTPGQAVLVESPEMKVGKRPFTFTGLLTAPELEFTIKLYHDHHGVTDHLTDYKRRRHPEVCKSVGGHQISRNREPLWPAAPVSRRFSLFCENLSQRRQIRRKRAVVQQ